MPEISNNFRLGRMEKDLDDRLVPNGGYRDALNVEVATSEGSDVGALQKVLGNTLITGLPTLPADAKCIGSVRDTKNNNIYWFVTGTNFDFIAEYNGTVIDMVLVDTGTVLDFAPDSLITGVNILDEVIYFTDNRNEPRQVDIVYWKSVTNNNHTTTSTGLTADKITVIRKSPISSPTFSSISSATVTGPGTIDGDQILMKINNVLDLNLSSHTVGQVVPLITFIKVIDSTAVDTNFIVGTRFDSTSEEGYKVSFTVTAVNTALTPDSFTAVIDSIDDRILPSDSNSFSVSSMPSPNQKFVKNGATGLQSNETALNGATILEINATGSDTASKTQILVPTTDTYNVTFNIKISQIDNTTTRDVFAQIKKNGSNFGGQINWGSTPSTQQLVLNNQQLNQNDIITIFVGEGNAQGTPPSSNQNDPIFTVHTDTNWSFVDTSFFSGINSYTVLAKQEYGFFEDKFPRFSYRYKYDDGLYSAFAAFYKVGFIHRPFA